MEKFSPGGGGGGGGEGVSTLYGKIFSKGGGGGEGINYYC